MNQVTGLVHTIAWGFSGFFEWRRAFGGIATAEGRTSAATPAQTSLFGIMGRVDCRKWQSGRGSPLLCVPRPDANCSLPHAEGSSETA
ncbi:MAG: hypothetical protein L0K77_07605, partial [Bifidobacterium crudilactis]|nr:hypothetical protein [Bifidobacterium crudilactis]